MAKDENFHITIVFCGYLTDMELEQLKAYTKKATSEIEEFELVPEKIIFSPKHKPRMVWLTFKNSPEFMNLTRKFIDFSDKNSEKPLPHVTLVRFQQQHYPNLKPLLKEDGLDIKSEIKPFVVESIDIMESHLNRHGPKYELVCRNCLK